MDGPLVMVGPADNAKVVTWLAKKGSPHGLLKTAR
jgi:hypothetical protein